MRSRSRGPGDRYGDDALVRQGALRALASFCFALTGNGPPAPPINGGGEPARGASASWAELSSRRLRDVRKSHEQEFHSNEGLMLVWREHRRAATDYRDSGSPVFGAPAHKGGEESNGGFGVSALPIDPRARGRFAGHRVVRVMRQMR